MPRRHARSRTHGREGREPTESREAVQAPSRHGPPERVWLVGIVIAAGIAAYLTSFAGVFLFDDVRHIVQNEQITDFTRLWGRRPLVNLSLALNFHFGALNPWGYHLVNLGVHLAAGMTLFGLVRRTLRLRPQNVDLVAAAPWVAFAAAMLWVVHPLQTQSVTYVIQRAESIMGLCYLLTLYCLLRGATSTQRGTVWLIGAVVVCALGMTAKAVMVTAPAVAFLFDALIISRSPTRALRQRGWVYAALLSTLVLLVLTGTARGVLSAAPGRRTVGFGYDGVTPFEYVATQPGVILHYLRLAAWPRGLCLDYLWPVTRGGVAIVLPALVLLTLLGMSIWSLRRRPALGFLGLSFFVVLAPTSSFIPIKDLAFEHRMYLPLAAIVIALVLGARALLGRLTSVMARRVIGGVVLAVVSSAFIWATAMRNRVYHDPETMWRDVAAKRPQNPRPRRELARLLGERGDLDGAIMLAREALAVDPDDYLVQGTLGQVLAKAGQFDRAVVYLERALVADPDFVVAHNDLGNALAGLGRKHEAIAHYREALRLEPGMAEAHGNLAIELHRSGDPDAAIAHFVEAIRLNPRSEAVNNLAVVLSGRPDPEAAIAPYLDRAPLQVPHARAYVRIGDGHLRAGRRAEAIAAYERALVINPSDVDASRRLASMGPRG